MLTKNIIEGLSILYRYCDDKENYNLSIYKDHDPALLVFWGFELEVSSEDKAKLTDLGWKLDESDGYPYWHCSP